MAFSIAALADGWSQIQVADADASKCLSQLSLHVQRSGLRAENHSENPSSVNRLAPTSTTIPVYEVGIPARRMISARAAG